MTEVNQPRGAPAAKSAGATGPSNEPEGAKARLADALTRTAAGDQEAFSEFYDLMSGLIHGIVLKVVRNPAMAEEVTQDVFLELWRLAPRWDPSKGSPRGWSTTIAHRRAVDRVRSEESARARDHADARAVVRDHDSVVEAVTTRMDRAEVREALELLSETQRQAVSMAYFGGYTYREVARLLDVPEGTIKTRIRDGLIRLHKLMDQRS